VSHDNPYARVDEPPNNPLKAPLFALCGLIGVVGAVVGARDGVAWLIVLGVVLVISSAWTVRFVLSGRNPRWLQSPLDRRWPR
jgi:hypothetical protein